MRVLRTSMMVAALVAGACSAGDQVGPTTTAALAPATSEAAPAAATTATSSTSVAVLPVTTDDEEDGALTRVVVAEDTEPITLNPYAPGGDSRTVSVIGQAHMAGVYDIDPETLELIPELVVELPTVANEGVTVNDDGTMDVTWTLRDEAVWSDGEPIGGSDLEFTLEFQRTSLEMCSFAFAPDPPPEVEVVEVSAKALTVRFASASLQHELLFPWVVPAHAVAGTDYCEDWNDTTWPSAGPFIFEEWVRNDAERVVRMVRNPNYWKRDPDGMQLPHFDAVEFRFIPDLEVLLAAFGARQIDVINPPPFVQALPVDSWRKAGAEVQIVEGPIWEHLNFQFGPGNRNAASLNGILEFRRAVAYGLNRRALLDDAGYPWLSVSDGFVRHSNRNATSDPWGRYTFDPEMASSLLAAACQTAGRDCAADPPQIVFSTTSNAAFRPAIAEQVAVQLGAIGIVVELQLEDSQLFFGDTLNDGSWDMGMWAWGGGPGAVSMVHQVRVFAPDEPPPDGDNSYRWGSPGSMVEGQEAPLQVQLLIDEMRSSSDADRVFSLASQLEDILADQAVIIPLGGRAAVGAAWGDRVEGYRMNPSPATHTWNIEHWYRAESG